MLLLMVFFFISIKCGNECDAYLICRVLGKCDVAQPDCVLKISHNSKHSTTYQNCPMCANWTEAIFENAIYLCSCSNAQIRVKVVAGLWSHGIDQCSP